MVRSNKALFLDRDGTLIRTFVSKKKIPKAIKTIKDFRLLKNVKYVIRELSKKFLIIVITNQPDVSRGKNTKRNVIKINSKLNKVLKIDKIYTSYSKNDNNFFRKPNPGMIFSAKKKFNINLKKSFVIGDRDKDIIAGKRAGCKTIFLIKSYNNFKITKPDFSIRDFKKLLKITKS